MPVFLKRVGLRNYKSIAECDVALGPFTLLVGRNGSGKSNFLDALRFVGESLKTSVDHALKSRGGIDEVRRIRTGHPRNFSIEMELHLSGEWGTYFFEIGSQPKGSFIVKEEKLEVRTKNWIQQWIRGRRYSETVDQPKLTSRMDLPLCRQRSPSFDKLCREHQKRHPMPSPSQSSWS